jgi:hypothetical protein
MRRWRPASLSARSSSAVGSVAARSSSVLAAEVAGTSCLRLMSAGCSVARWTVMPRRLWPPVGSVTWMASSRGGRKSHRTAAGRDHAAGGEGGGHRRGVRGFERADEIDASVQAPEVTGVHSLPDHGPTPAGGHELRKRHDPVLTPGEPADPRFGTHFCDLEHPQSLPVEEMRPHDAYLRPHASGRRRGRRNASHIPDTLPHQPPFAGSLSKLGTDPSHPRDETCPSAA